jgi:hypothetical protein
MYIQLRDGGHVIFSLLPVLISFAQRSCIQLCELYNGQTVNMPSREVMDDESIFNCEMVDIFDYRVVSYIAHGRIVFS